MKLWERREVETQRSKDSGPKNILDFFKMQNNKEKEYTWFCKATFEPKSQAVQEVQWSGLNEDGTQELDLSGGSLSFSDANGVVSITFSTAAAVPEPSTYALLAGSLLLVSVQRRKSRPGMAVTK